MILLLAYCLIDFTRIAPCLMRPSRAILRRDSQLVDVPVELQRTLVRLTTSIMRIERAAMISLLCTKTGCPFEPAKRCASSETFPKIPDLLLKILSTVPTESSTNTFNN